MSFDFITWAFGFVAGALLTGQVWAIIHKVLMERERL